MTKYIQYASVLIIGTMVATYLCASQDLTLKKKEYTFHITLSERDNPTKIGLSNLLDESDKFACNILNLFWPEKADNGKLWRIQTTRTKTGDLQQYVGPMTISDFSSTIKTNPYFKTELAGSFSFPKALSDITVQELVKSRKITQKTENETTIHLILENSYESLQKIGLVGEKIKTQSHSFIPYLFIGSIAGLSLIAYLLKTHS